MPWRAIHRTRSKLAHHYDDLQRTVVWETLVRDLPTLRSHLVRRIRVHEGAERGGTTRSGASRERA